MASSFDKKLAKAKTKMKKVVKPTVRKAGKATVGAGKLITAAGYKGVGRKTSNAGRAAVKASKVKSAQSAINAALKASDKNESLKFRLTTRMAIIIGDE